MDFDEESIKKRIVDMLEDYKKGGGVMELGDEEFEDDEDYESEDVEDKNRKKLKRSHKNKQNTSKDFSVDDTNEHEDEDMTNEDGDEGDDDDDDDDDNQRNKEPHIKQEKRDRVAEREKRQKSKFDFERNSRTIFVGNLPNTLDHKGVAKLFKCCGEVESARIRSIVPDKEKLSKKVAIITKKLHPKVDSFNAYVVFKTNENDECVKKALKMNGKVIEGHHIHVDRAQRPKSKKETLTSRKKSVFVGNLRFDLRDDDLIKFFSKSGSVNYVRIVRDSSTGLGKGFGFVVFDERASVKKALELNETQFKGRTIRVKKIDK